MDITHQRPAADRTPAISRTQPAQAPAAPHARRPRRWTSILVATAVSTAMATTMAASPAQAQVPAAPVSAAAVTRVPTMTATATATFVTAVYRDLFGRAVDAAGLANWTNALANGTPRDAVANSITYSDEYRARLIGESYQAYLGRGADAAGLRGWVDAMRYGTTFQEMEAGFLASDEYYSKAGSSDAEWVRRLYSHVLGRAAGAAEVRGWVDAIAGGTTRYAVAMGFLVSTEHLTTVVDGHYRHLLGRGIDASGAAGWVNAIQNGYRVEAIIGGIVASDEYVTRNVGTTAPVVTAPVTTAPVTTAPVSTAPVVAPRPGGQPTASNTGVPAGTVLTVHQGDQTITTPNLVIDGWDIRGFVTIAAPGVVIKNSIIRGTATDVQRALVSSTSDTASVTIEDSELYAASPSGWIDGIRGWNITARRVNIHHVIDAVHIYGNNVTVEASWLHDNLHYLSDPAQSGGASHDDSIQIQVGTNIRITGNSISGAYNTGIQFTQDQGAVSNVTIAGNWADGGGCTINLAEKGVGPFQGIVITDNVFGRTTRVANCAIISPTTTVIAAERNVYTDGTVATVRKGS